MDMDNTSIERETLLRRTAIIQDTINGITNPTPWPTRWWAMSGDLLWTAGIANASGVDAIGVAYEPGDIVVHQHTIQGDSTRLTMGFGIMQPGDTDPSRQIANGIAQWANGAKPDVRTVEQPGAITFRIDGKALPMGWAEALARAESKPDAGPDAVRLALLQAGLERGIGEPSSWYLEDSGDDLISIDWHVNGQGLVDSYGLRHLQYSDDMGPRLETIAHSVAPAPISPPQRLDDSELMARGRQIYNRYQTSRNHNGGPDAWDITHHVARGGIIRRGERPLLDRPNDGKLEDWDTLIDRTACQLLTDGHARTREPGARAATSPTPNGRKGWPNAWVDNDAARPYTLHARDGREWDKMIIRLPAGTVIDGRRLDGWAFDLFASDAIKRQKSEGRDVNVRLRPGRGVELFQGRGEKRRSVTIDDPAKLCAAIAEARKAAKRKTPDMQAKQPPAVDTATPLSEEMRSEVIRLREQKDDHTAAFGLARYAVGNAWESVDRLQNQLIAYMDAGKYDAGLALKATKRAIDRVAVQHAQQHDVPQARSVADTRFSAEDRRAAALLLLDTLVGDHNDQDITDRRNPIRERAKDETERKETAIKEEAAATQAEPDGKTDKGDRRSLLSMLRDKAAEALSGQRHRSQEHKQKHSR
ncbi:MULTISPECIES: hypothetical protein [Bifidobacterium]|uniref:Uncharacterized protein n=2 Tax=Bifidobacterium TaxID=1678 RepID=A0A261FPH4_9BIFI|nr:MULTISPECIES: hypothetical protein [Bifidobacterium]OZG60716.1 hypothetical protein BLEM_1685 [Bifidobacterium lemurum]OZG69614.1 hypothetical protein BEUL_0031 [Bifidobacterium eulemuris]QOL32269.1 hypothetical protein BE0216_07235 [Bifidobacterium eulemuris]QOL35229.1 hypothetical protein BL8807_05100 [Bifidobacterium lemurum]